MYIAADLVELQERLIGRTDDFAAKPRSEYAQIAICALMANSIGATAQRYSVYIIIRLSSFHCKLIDPFGFT